ncbi:amine oxidase [Gautieria morchelliformis]|nr:amine oxidase [Gautieria morchelliformis]
MILQDLGIDYEILEANKIVGGRLFTHHFGEKPNDYYASRMLPSNSYDVGAMRFPDIPLMETTFKLFRRLNFDKKTQIPYYLSTPRDVTLFNGFLVSGPIPNEEDPFHVSESKGGLVPDEFAQKGYSHWIDEKLRPFKEALVKDFDEGWKYLMQYEGHSFRTYMTMEDPKYPNSVGLVVDWCETMDSGTGLFDLSLAEAVMDSLDFDFPQKDVKWSCIHGGAQKIALGMAATLGPAGQPIFGKRVTRIALSRSKDWPPKILASVHDEHTPRSYNHIVSTIPLSALRMVDTEGCDLSYALKTGMRMLEYGGSVKVGIQFTDRWWEPTHQGGVSKTDRQTRVVVYPSYGIGDSDSGATMLVSYTWGQDALRQGALVQGPHSTAESILLKLILQDLSAMHEIPYDTLKNKVKAFHEWNWYGDAFTVGAWAAFGPGQFNTLYPEVTKPAAHGLLHFAGEATSVNHAWVAGALDSAYRCVMQIVSSHSFAIIPAERGRLLCTAPA